MGSVPFHAMSHACMFIAWCVKVVEVITHLVNITGRLKNKQTVFIHHLNYGRSINELTSCSVNHTPQGKFIR